MATSYDLRLRIITCWNEREQTKQQIADRFQVSLGLVKKLVSQYQKLGHVRILRGNVGRKRALSPEMVAKIKGFYEKNPGMTLAEAKDASGAECHVATICRELQRQKITYKKKSDSKRAVPRGRRRETKAIQGDNQEASH